MIRKLANAFYPDAEPSDQVRGIALFSGTRYKKKHGGLWVGGEVIMSRDSILFTPNTMNLKLHKNLCSVEIPASDIESVKRNFGWFTGIVEVKHAQGIFRFRCYGASSLVARYLGSGNTP